MKNERRIIVPGLAKNWTILSLAPKLTIDLFPNLKLRPFFISKTIEIKPSRVSTKITTDEITEYKLSPT